MPLGLAATAGAQSDVGPNSGMSGKGCYEFVRILGRSKDGRPKVNAKGRQQGLREGDLVVSVNGQPTSEMTHAEAQRAVRESTGTVELQVQRRVPARISGMNGESALKNRDLSRDSSPFHPVEDEANHNHSWSTDSTSTGSTIIHISPHSSEEQSSSGTDAVWSPSTRKKINLKLNCDLSTKYDSAEEKPRQIEAKDQSSTKENTDDDTSPVWQPFGAPYDGPQFRPVKLEVTTTTTTTTKKATTAVPQSELPKKDENETTEDKISRPTEKMEGGEVAASSPVPAKETSVQGKTTPEVPPSPSTAVTFVKSGWSSHLPPSQSPTITLLQKAREGQLPKGAIYLDEKQDSTPLPRNAVLIDQKVIVEGDKVHTDSYYAVPTLETESSTHDIKAPPKYDGIGPTEYGIPVGLRTGVKEEYASDWYKTMYKSLHRGRYPNEPSHAVHYGGYMSEPEFDRKDAYRPKYATVDHRRKPEKSVSYTTEQPSSTETAKKFGSDTSVMRHELQKYRVEPRSIAEYEPGRSSLAEKEFQKFWSDFWDSMDDLHEHLGDISPRPQHQQGLGRRWANVLLSDGYESDSTLIRKTGRVPYVDPEQQKAWYKEIQKGGEIPFIGLRKSAPEKPSEIRSNKPQPATHVYGVEPPCFNHKHIPDSSCKLTPARIFRATPFVKTSPIFKQNCSGMATKRLAPEPPARVSSKRMNVLRSVISSSTQQRSREADFSENLGLTPVSTANTISGRTEFQNNGYANSWTTRTCHNRFHSSEDLYQPQDRAHSSFRSQMSHSKVQQTNKASNSSECIHSRSINICDNNPGGSFHSNFLCNSLEDKQYPSTYKVPLDCYKNFPAAPDCFRNIRHQHQRVQNFSSFTCACCRHLGLTEGPAVSTVHSDLIATDQKHVTNSLHYNDKINENTTSQIDLMKTPSIISKRSNLISACHTCITNSCSNEAFNRNLTSNSDIKYSNISPKYSNLFYDDQKSLNSSLSSSDDISLNLNESRIPAMISETNEDKGSKVTAFNPLPDTERSSSYYEWHSKTLNTSNKLLPDTKDSFLNSCPNLSQFSSNKIHCSFDITTPIDFLKKDNLRTHTSNNSTLTEANVFENNLMHLLNHSDSEKRKCARHFLTSRQSLMSPLVAEDYCKVTLIADDNVKKILSPQVNINIKNARNLEVPKLYPEKILPRMITILPSVIHVSKVPVVDLEPKLVHSEPQVNEKHFCKIDLNPLRMYLKRYQTNISQNFDEYTFKQDSEDIKPNGSSKLNILENNNYDAYANGLVLPKHICKEIKHSSNLLTCCDSSLVNNNNCATAGSSINKYSKSPLKTLPVLKTSVLKSPNMSCQYSNNRKNIFMNKNNAIFYHKYISTMVHSIAKSRKFLYLVNFYSSLAGGNNNSFKDHNKFQVIKIKEFDITWHKRPRYCKWESDQDKSLRVKRSSVEDLRQLFQSIDSNKKENRNVQKVSFHYQKLWYNVSVSNLVEKYNNIQSSQENLEVRLNSDICCNSRSKDRFPSKHNLDDNSEYSVPINFQRIPVDMNPQKHVNFSECMSPQCVNTLVPSFSTSVSSSCSDLRFMPHLSQDVRTKVQYFEDISQTNRLKKYSSIYQYTSTSVRVGKFSHSRNLSWTDLREIENFSSADKKSVFSPQYLPEKAMSCLDLTFVSECSQSTTEQSLANSDRGWASSTASCISQESTEKYNDMHIRSIKTGTVSRIKNKLEKFVMSRSQSVPHNITSMSSEVCEENKCSSLGFPMLSSSGSVQNLKRLFEIENTRTSVANSSFISWENRRRNESFSCRSEVEVTVIPKEECRYENALNIYNTILDNSNLMEQCVRNRIQSLISKFEQNNLFDSTKRIASGYGKSLCSLNVSNFCRHSFNEASVTRTTPHTELTFSIKNSVSSYTIADAGTKHSKHLPQETGGWVRNTFDGEKNSLHSENWMKLYIPRVKNSFPKPYVKKGNNSICSPLKTRHPASPHQYQETEVNIHYRSPIRHLEKEYIEEEELRKRQEDAMRKFYEEEKRKKHQQELAEIEMRRHSDFFTASQKSPIPLNRYDNPFDTSYGSRLAPPGVHRGPPPKTMARALFPFTAQTTRELSLNKGDIVYITKQIDKNWYEGEHHGLIGIFPVNYVEIIPNEKANMQPRKASEGEAVVKYNFRAQTPIELSLFKGEKVILTKRMDQNWYEGRLGTKKGIFPVSYVNVLQEPGEHTYGSRAISPKPPASPVYSPIVNGSPPKVEGPTFNTGLRPLQDKPPLNLDRLDNKSSLTQSLHIDTYNEPIPYRSLYSYKPQNDDELELKEGDTVYVMEKCDDGWYVGTSLRTGLFGTFPGNYVERI